MDKPARVTLTGKRGKSRVVPLGERTRTHLAAYLDLDDLAFLFRQVRIYFSHRCDIPSDWFSRQFPI